MHGKLSSHIPIIRPVLGTEELEKIQEVIESGWLVQGTKVHEFEGLISEFTGAGYAVAASSCTSALHLALLAAGAGPGDQVLLPSFTFVATANAIEYTGAEPVFVDIDLSTFTIDPFQAEAMLKKLKKAENGKSRFIIPVSLFGLCADMTAVNQLANEYGLLVIEDAACGLGATRNDRHAGTEALAGCFSFHPRKTITTGEGGMIITDDETIFKKVQAMRDHGASKDALKRHPEEGGSLLPDFNMLGFNYRLTDLQGALGVVQMKRLPEIIKERAALADRYNTLLKEVSGISSPSVPGGYVHAYQSYVCLYGIEEQDFSAGSAIDWREISDLNRSRNRIMAELERKNISVRQGTHAVHTLGYYMNKYHLKERDYPFSFIADRLSITLPLYCGMTEEDQDRVVETLRSCL